MTYKRYLQIKETSVYIYFKYLTKSGSGQLIIKYEYLGDIVKKFNRLFKECVIVKQVYMKFEDDKLYFTRRTEIC